MPTSEMTWLVVGGFVLFMGAMIGLTTWGGKYPRTTLSLVLLALVAYVAIILVRLGWVGWL